jgi:methylenetetrahydrofolate--tRNA-(uracil-5-)-methyltransferase
MRPSRRSPAHRGDHLAELVCSNSLRSNQLANAVGLLKEEMRRLGSLILEVADASAVPAGRALAVDRHAFAAAVTDRIERHPRIELRRERLRKLPDDPRVILATGPLTDPELAANLQTLLGERSLYFYDSISPVVYADSIDPSVAFSASRWEDGEGDYLNLPLDATRYRCFVGALVAADTVPLHPFERALYFEGCLPIEEMARRGRDTLAHGPMKPVGLRDPETGRRPHAVVQLRQEDRRGVLRSLVGFQTKLRIGAQREIFRSLPGMQGAVFARYGSVHRNTYVNAPRHLRPDLQVNGRPGLHIAGQLAGVEGYVESAALGGLAGIFAARGDPLLPPVHSAHGSLLRYLREASADRFQPMNVTFGLFDPLPAARRGLGQGRKEPKRERHARMADRALRAFAPWCEAVTP